jgi:ribosomal protein L44E
VKYNTIKPEILFIQCARSAHHSPEFKHSLVSPYSVPLDEEFFDLCLQWPLRCSFSGPLWCEDYCLRCRRHDLLNDSIERNLVEIGLETQRPQALWNQIRLRFEMNILYIYCIKCPTQHGIRRVSMQQQRADYREMSWSQRRTQPSHASMWVLSFVGHPSDTHLFLKSEL